MNIKNEVDYQLFRYVEEKKQPGEHLDSSRTIASYKFKDRVNQIHFNCSKDPVILRKNREEFWMQLVVNIAEYKELRSVLSANMMFNKDSTIGEAIQKIGRRVI